MTPEDSDEKIVNHMIRIPYSLKAKFLDEYTTRRLNGEKIKVNDLIIETLKTRYNNKEKDIENE